MPKIIELEKLKDLVLTRQDVRGLVRELERTIKPEELAQALGREQLEQWSKRKREGYPAGELWKLKRVVYEHGLFSLLPAHGIPPMTFDIEKEFDILGTPVGLQYHRPLVPARNWETGTDIAGFSVDFPLA